MTTPNHFKLETYINDLSLPSKSPPAAFSKLCEVNYDDTFHTISASTPPSALTDVLLIKGRYKVCSICVFGNITKYNTPPDPQGTLFNSPHFDAELFDKLISSLLNETAPIRSRVFTLSSSSYVLIGPLISRFSDLLSPHAMIAEAVLQLICFVSHASCPLWNASSFSINKCAFGTVD